MPSEREKMLAGALYDPLDPELVAGRQRARDLCQTLNATREGEADARRAILRELFGEIGADVWVGGAALILPGVRIGSRTVIGAGSVVTRDVPDGVLAAGNPCRVIREITE
jgi:hypothetical protein